MPPIVNQYDLIAGIGQIGGLWVPPGAGRGLAVGTVLDRDPLLNTTTTITQSAGNVLAITETGGAHTTEWTYDTNSGILQAIRQELRTFGIRVELRCAQV